MDRLSEMLEQKLTQKFSQIELWAELSSKGEKLVFEYKGKTHNSLLIENDVFFKTSNGIRSIPLKKLIESNKVKVRGEPTGLRVTRSADILFQIKKSDRYTMINMHSTPSGMVALIRDEETGDAYEVEVKPSYHGNYFQKERGLVDEDYATMDDDPEDYLDGQKFVG